MEASLFAALNSDEEYSKTVHENGIRRRIGNNTILLIKLP